MPYINIKLAGSVTKDQKEKICAGVTSIVCDVTGKKPESTYVVIEEIERENWAKGGSLLG